MAAGPYRFGRLAVKSQGSGWGTAETSFGASNVIEAEATTPEPTQESLVTENAMRGNVYAQRRVPGRKSAQVSLRMPLHGFSDAAPTADPTEHPDALLLKTAIGGSSLAGYNASDITGGTTTDWTYGTGTTDAGWEAHALLTTVSGGSKGIGWVTNVDTTTDTATVFDHLAAAPTSGSAVYGSNTIYLVKDQPTPLTLEWLGSDASSRIRMYDGVVSEWEIDGSAGPQPVLTCTVVGTLVNDGSGGDPGTYAFTDYPQLPATLAANGSRLTVNATTTTVHSFTIRGSATVMEGMGHQADQAVAQRYITDRTAECEVVLIPSSLATLSAPGTAPGAVQLDLNTTPGRAFSLLMPSPQQRDIDAISDQDGMLALTRVYDPLAYTSDDTTDGTSAPRNTPFRIAFL